MASFEKFKLDQGSWVTSLNYEHFDCSESFPVRDDALAFGRSEGHQYIGQINRPNPAQYIDVETILEDIVENNEPFLGEVWEGYLFDMVTPDKRNDLNRRLRKSMEDWLEEHGHWPTQCNVEHVERIEASS